MRTEQLEQTAIWIIFFLTAGEDGFSEMARLSRILGDMLIPADVVALSREYFDLCRDTPNIIA